MVVTAPPTQTTTIDCGCGPVTTTHPPQPPHPCENVDCGDNKIVISECAVNHLAAYLSEMTTSISQQWCCQPPGCSNGGGGGGEGNKHDSPAVILEDTCPKGRRQFNYDGPNGTINSSGGDFNCT